MKKFYFLAAIAALALGLGSCTSEEVIDPVALNSEANAIGFGTFLDKTSKDSPFALPRQKATNIDKESLKTYGFKVSAYATGMDNWATAVTKKPFMDNEEVEWVGDGTGTGGTWTYSPTKYWPMEINGSVCEWTKVSFFAISIAPSATIVANSGIPTMSFGVEKHAAEQSDLVVDAVVDKTGEMGTVKLNFDHILSKIEFQATLDGASTKDNDATTVTVNSVMVTYGKDMLKASIYTFNSGSNTAIENWDTNVGPGVTPWGAPPLVSGSVTDGTAHTLTASAATATLGSPMMIIPQNSTIIGLTPMTVTLNYTITTADAKLTASNSEWTETYDRSFVLDGTNYFPAYLPGKHYIFNFNIKLKAVECEAVGVKDWDPAGTKDIKCPDCPKN